MFTHAQLFNWHEQPCSNQGDLDSSVMGGSESLLHRGGPASDLIFVGWYMIVVGLHFKWYTPKRKSLR
jgi:hypothetical protein